jgi:hypothetical protein
MVKRNFREPVKLHNNGVRSYVPPCFCWELTSEDGQLLEVVSDLDLSHLKADPIAQSMPHDKLLYRLDKGEFLVTGFVEEYPTKPTAILGRRLFITHLFPRKET